MPLGGNDFRPACCAAGMNTFQSVEACQPEAFEEVENIIVGRRQIFRRTFGSTTSDSEPVLVLPSASQEQSQ